MFYQTNSIIAGYISKSYEKALDERDDSQEEFDKLDSTTSDEQRAKWVAQEAHAQANCLHDVKAMDIYSSKLEGGEYSLYRPLGFLLTYLFSESAPSSPT